MTDDDVRRLGYTPPQVMRLSPGQPGRAATCGPGSTPTFFCEPGNQANGCHTGTEAFAACSTGDGAYPYCGTGNGVGI